VRADVVIERKPKLTSIILKQQQISPAFLPTDDIGRSDSSLEAAGSRRLLRADIYIRLRLRAHLVMIVDGHRPPTDLPGRVRTLGSALGRDRIGHRDLRRGSNIFRSR